jgi:membrane protease YdiL (CAAX protease family)
MSWNAYPVPEIMPPVPDDPVEMRAVPRETPTLLEMVAFFTLTAILLTAIQGIGAAVALHWHVFGRITLKNLAYEPRFTIPMMVLSYGVVLLVASALFRRVWQRGFFAGIHWNWQVVRRRWMWLPVLGVGLGFTVQLVSNYLPVPKELPVNAFFRNATDAWMVALFGVFIAPIAEEIAFRGFLYPSLRPWTGRILAAILTSVPFALLHAQQVAHAWGPLAMVFLVSMVLVAIRERTGSVAGSALVHACYNLSIFAVIFYASGGFQHLERLKD